MHVAVFHIPVFRFRSVHRTDGAEHTGDFSAFQILRRHKPCLRTPESAGTIPLAAGKSQLKNRSPDTAVLRRRKAGNSAALQDLILSLAVSAAFLRNPDFRPFIRFLTKHCPVRAGPVF